MVKFILSMMLVFSWPAMAQFLGFGESTGDVKSRIPELVDKLKSVDLKLEPQYEEAFNKEVKNIENAMEEEKLYCSGEAVDASGKLLPADKKQFCIRELKKQYLEAMGAIFDLKKKYLELIHTRQLQRLTEVHAKLKNNIDKNF